MLSSAWLSANIWGCVRIWGARRWCRMTRGALQTTSVLCSSIKSGERRRNGEMFGVMTLHYHLTVTPFSRKGLDTRLPVGRTEWIPWFALLAHRALLPLVNSISTHVFSSFCPSHCLPHRTVGQVSKWLRGTHLPPWPNRLTAHSKLSKIQLNLLFFSKKLSSLFLLWESKLSHQEKH